MKSAGPHQFFNVDQATFKSLNTARCLTWRHRLSWYNYLAVSAYWCNVSQCLATTWLSSEV